MKMMLDTHIALWAMADTEKLPQTFLDKLKDLNNSIFVSVASVWEVAIKNIKNDKLMPISEKEFINFCKEMEFEFMPIKLAHIMNIRNLKLKDENITHKDPFDKIIIAQSEYENVEFYTRDKTLKDYAYENINII